MSRPLVAQTPTPLTTIPLPPHYGAVIRLIMAPFKKEGRDYIFLYPKEKK